MSLFEKLIGPDYDGKPHKYVEVSPELAKKILYGTRDNWSIKKIAEYCECTTREVRAVYWEEKKWRQIFEAAANKEAKEDMAYGDKMKHAQEVLPKEKFEEYLKAKKTDPAIAEETSLELWQVKKLKKIYKLTGEPKNKKLKKDSKPVQEPPIVESEVPIAEPVKNPKMEILTPEEEKEQLDRQKALKRLEDLKQLTPIAGVGPETPTRVNEAGGKQSDIPYRCDLLGGKAILEIARILHKGATKYAENNWRLIESRSHLNHALTHIFAYLAGDTQDEHLEHALCRMMMAVETKDQKCS